MKYTSFNVWLDILCGISKVPFDIDLTDLTLIWGIILLRFVQTNINEDMYGMNYWYRLNTPFFCMF